MAAEADLSNARIIGDQLLLLLDGAFMAARLFGTRDHPGRHVANAAATLVDHAT